MEVSVSILNTHTQTPVLTGVAEMTYAPLHDLTFTKYYIFVLRKIIIIIILFSTTN